MRLNYTERALFILSDHHYGMENIFPYLPRCFLEGSGCFQAISWVFFKGDLRLFQEYFNVILEFVMSVPRVFLGCFCPIELTLVADLTSVYRSKPFFDKKS